MSPSEKLKEIIFEKEKLLLIEKEELKLEFIKAYKNLNPLYELTNSFKSAIGGSGFKNTLFQSILGMAASAITNKSMGSDSKKPYKKIISFFVQTVVIELISKNSEWIKDKMGNWIDKILNRQESV